jgi:hypothetical protein
MFMDEREGIHLMGCVMLCRYTQHMNVLLQEYMNARGDEERRRSVIEEIIRNK